jgi:hypothetical protein
MISEANDIFKQARQGSVAAIIQVLNEKLADDGVRTRAVFADGKLQLLCEAPLLEQLEQPVLVERVRSILEAIAPRSIRRVNINSRIVREQQLLWLEEISRDPEQQVLWSEEITLKQPNFFKRLAEDWGSRSTESSSEVNRASAVKPSFRQQREQRQFQRGLIGGILATVGLLAGGWWLYTRYSPSFLASAPAGNAPTSPASPGPATAPPSPAPNPFVAAVRLAEQTSQASQTAQTSAEWLALAAQWQKAADLMAQVPTEDTRYKTAQNRVVTYRQNSDIALQKAKSQ